MEEKKKATKKTTKKKEQVNVRVAELIQKIENQEVSVPKPVKEKKQTKQDKNIKQEKIKQKKQMPTEITKDSVELKEIEEAINEQKITAKEKMEKANKRIFQNIVIAIAIMLYFIFINLGFVNIIEKSFLLDIQVFSITLIATAIIIWEQAYKKDSGMLTIHGIETLFLAISTLVLPKIYVEYNNVFQPIVASISFLFGIYYVGKSIIIYIKIKRKIRKSDVNKLARKGK